MNLHFDAKKVTVLVICMPQAEAGQVLPHHIYLDFGEFHINIVLHVLAYAVFCQLILILLAEETFFFCSLANPVLFCQRFCPRFSLMKRNRSAVLMQS